MILLQANNVMRRFGADVLFHDINLQIQEHGRTALVGRNGAGKTTLLKMIAGITNPDEGTISKSKDLTIGYLAQDQGLDSQNSIWAELDLVFAPLHKMEKQIHQLENQLASLDPATKEFQLTTEKYSQLQSAFKKQGGFEYESRMRGILKGFGFEEADYQTAINSLSGGQKTKLALAKILLQSPDLLILDEPTNHLDMNVLAWLEDYLKSYQGALLVVSHDRYFLDRVVSDIYDLDNHTLRHYTGNYTQFMQHKQEWLTAEWKHYEQQQKKIAKLEDFVNRNIVRASTTKRAQARRKQLEKMDRMDRPETDDRSIHFHFHSDKDSGNEVLDVDRAVVGYNDQKLAGPLSFSVRKPQRVGIIGPNGIGKSTLLKSILDRIPLISGSIKLGANLQIGYYDQEHQVLNPDNTVFDEISDAYPQLDNTKIRSVLAAFLFTGDDVFKLIRDLSGGERGRVSLAKLMLSNANFLILDEPTNHLDIVSKEILENVLRNYTGTVFYVSHDRYFINTTATRILELTGGGLNSYIGNYDDYLEKKEHPLVSGSSGGFEHDAGSPASGSTAASASALSYQEQKQQKALERKRQNDLAKVEQRIDEIEQRINMLDEMMADEAICTDVTRLMEISQEKEKLDGQLLTLMEQWETLSQ